MSTIKIIDFHTHCFPDAIAARAIAALTKRAEIPNHHNGTLAGLDRTQRAAGCDGYVILPIATAPNQTASVNRFAGQAQDTARGVYAFGSIHPENTDYKQQLAAVKELGLRGIKMHPEYQLFHVNDEALFPLYEEIFRLGFPLLFHAGEDLGFQPPWHAQPHKIAQLALRYPEACIIAAHMGGYRMWEEALEVLAPLPNVYIDTSYYAGRMDAHEILRICEAWGYDRVLFGSDAPWTKVQAAVEAVRQLPCTQAEHRKVFAENALRLLG